MIQCASVDCQALGPLQIPRHMDGGFDEIGPKALTHSPFDEAEIGQIGGGLLAMVQHEKAVGPSVAQEGEDVDVLRLHKGGEFIFGLGVAVFPFVVAPHGVIEVEKVPVRRVFGVDQRTWGIPHEAWTGKARAVLHREIGDGVLHLLSGFSQTRVLRVGHAASLWFGGVFGLEFGERVHASLINLNVLIGSISKC